jgi:hypothetical protein
VVYLAQAVSTDLEESTGRVDTWPAIIDPLPMIALGIEPDRYRDLLVTTQQRYAVLSVRFS